MSAVNAIHARSAKSRAALLGAGLLLLAFGLSGCFSLHYALQAGAGEFTLLTSARPNEELLERPDTAPRLALLLAAVPLVKQFGESMGLTPTANDQRYTQLDRPAAVWVVSACPEFSLAPRLFEFPIAGAVPYLGWFELRAAKDFAATLSAQKLDVSVRGAAAFSTLGWFDDPLLSSMITPTAHDAALGDLAETVLHESAHATLYLPGQSSFNEGLAEFVALRLTPRFLSAHATSREAHAWTAQRARSAARAKLLHAATAQLEALYASSLSDEEKRAKKAATLAELAQALHSIRPLNNAVLSGHRTYSAGQRGFARLLAACGDDWRVFFSALRKLDPAQVASSNEATLDDLLERVAERIPAPTLVK